MAISGLGGYCPSSKIAPLVSVLSTPVAGIVLVGRLETRGPIPPMLFTLVSDVFSRMLAKAVKTNVISGIIPYIVPDSLVSLQISGAFL